MPLEGPVNNNFQLVEDLKQVAADAYAIRDDLGAKLANVYLYSKKMGEEAVWKQLLPTPSIQDLSFDQAMVEGGIVQRGDLRLGGIPVANYNNDDLRTDSKDRDVRKFIVIKEQGAEGKTKAYTALHISRRLLNYVIHVRRFDAINEDDLKVPEA